jgi:hypothetical protein
LVDNKSASIDERYQGLQFVYRIKDRPGRSADRPAPSSGRPVPSSGRAPPSSGRSAS